MNTEGHNLRKYSWKALERIREIDNKFPSGIPNVNAIEEESRKWIKIKIQQLCEYLKNVEFHSKPDWLMQLRLDKNKNSFQAAEMTESDFPYLCGKIFSNIENISRDLQDNIQHFRQKSKEKRKFENASSASFGSEYDRKQLVDAMDDMLFSGGTGNETVAFPQNKFAKIAEETLSEIVGHGNFRGYIQNHDVLSENIQTDLLDWLQKTQLNLEKENPFFDEAVFIDNVKRLSSQDIATRLVPLNSGFIKDYKSLMSVNEASRGNIAPSTLDFDFYSKSFSELKKNEKDYSEKLEALRRNFVSDMERNLIDRKNQWDMEKIDAARKKFLNELYKKVENFMKLEKILSPFFKNGVGLWGKSLGQFNASGFEILNQFADLLEKDESLRELAELLGRQNKVQASFEKELRDKTVIKTEWHPKIAYRGEIKGLRYSNDIAAVVPSELAMMKNPAAKKLFQLKFSQKQLLSFQYQNEIAESKEKNEKEEITVSKEEKEPKGPVIICVDTSGSMSGTPENIAKTVTFALSKIAIEEERKCYLISFSVGIETLDLSDFKNGDSLSKLVGFLRMSFCGGTDASPALNHAVKMLKKDGYKNADVLMISDFVMGSLPENLVKSIKEEKEKGTDFYSLVIGSSGNNGAIKCFNHNWLYDMSNPHAQRRLVEQLHELKTAREQKHDKIQN